MANEMIERVAKAIGGLWNDRCNPCTDKKIVKCDECLETAKAAIAAMREPTDSMFNGKFGVEARKHFTDMIDAALKDAS